MKRNVQGVLLAGLLAAGLAACSSSPTNGSADSDKFGSNVESGYGSPGTGSTPAMPATGSGSVASEQSGAAAMASPAAVAQDKPVPAMAPPASNSRVVSIDPVPRNTAGGSTGSSGSSGTTGSSGTDNIYRVTVQMDDGSTRVLTQEWVPTFRAGDRVHVVDGAIQR